MLELLDAVRVSHRLLRIQVHYMCRADLVLLLCAAGMQWWGHQLLDAIDSSILVALLHSWKTFQ
jgi:hypothetical protein